LQTIIPLAGGAFAPGHTGPGRLRGDGQRTMIDLVVKAGSERR